MYSAATVVKRDAEMEQDEHFMEEDENKSKEQNKCTYSEYCDGNHNTS